MAKKIMFIGALLLATALPIAAKDNNATAMQFGNSELNDTQFKNLHHSGNLEMNKVKVQGSLIVNGRLEAKNSTFNDMTINGNTELKDVSVNGPVNINGQMEVKDSKFSKEVMINGHIAAESSQFKKQITVASSNIEFKKCELQNVHIQKSGGDKQKLELRATQVKGNIEFESNDGTVIMDKKSNITGKVIGGTVKKD